MILPSINQCPLPRLTDQIACTREQPACKRCRDENITDCKYSRSGVIRRNRKRKAPSISVASQRQSSPSTIASTGSPSNALLSNLTQEIEITAGQLESFGAAEASHQEPLGALSSLSQACAAVWHAGTSDPAIDQEMMGSRLYMFEERAEEWTDGVCFDSSSTAVADEHQFSRSLWQEADHFSPNHQQMCYINYEQHDHML